MAGFIEIQIGTYTKNQSPYAFFFFNISFISRKSSPDQSSICALSLAKLLYVK